MICTVEEARSKICVLQITSNISRPMMRSVLQCCANECMTYWRWADEAHTNGYCSITGKPEF